MYALSFIRKAKSSKFSIENQSLDGYVGFMMLEIKKNSKNIGYKISRNFFS